jgi:hypothetical protein
MLVILLLLFSWNSGCLWFSHMLQKQNWSKLSLLGHVAKFFLHSGSKEEIING